MIWQQINFTFFVLGAIFAFIFKKRLLRPEHAELPNEPFTRSEIIQVWIIAVLNPLVTGPLLYYGLKDRWPSKARQANRISILVLAIEAAIGISYFFLSSPIFPSP